MCEDKWLLSCSEGGHFGGSLKPALGHFGGPVDKVGSHGDILEGTLRVAALTQTFLTSTSLENQNVFAHKGRVLVVLSESFNLAEQCSSINFKTILLCCPGPGQYLLHW